MKLGILLNTHKNLKHLLGICEAARKAGVEVAIFIMDDGCYLTKNPELLALGKKGVNIALCDQSYREKGFTETLPGVKHGSQFDHALIAHECDRYIVL